MFTPLQKRPCSLFKLLVHSLLVQPCSDLFNSIIKWYRHTVLSRVCQMTVNSRKPCFVFLFFFCYKRIAFLIISQLEP